MTPNDLNDPDTGANNLQNFPIILAANPNGSGSVVEIAFNSEGTSNYLFQFFASPTCDPSGNGEGKTFLGASNFNSFGDPNINVVRALTGSITQGDFITATATNTTTNNTSEFSPCKQAASTFVVTNTNDSGAGSLRQAILDSNANVGFRDRIHFNIPGVNTHTISPFSAFPTITDPVIIDGSTQPGTLEFPTVQIDGRNLTSPTNGLTITAGDSKVIYLGVIRFNNGIVLQGAGNNQLILNFFGVDAALTIGDFDRGNTAAGVRIESSNNTLSGNYISFNGEGVFVNSGNGNDLSGNVYIDNDGRGIHLAAGANNNVAAPVITSTSTTSGVTTINGTYSGAPNTTYTLFFYGNTACDSSGFGEGNSVFTSIPVTTDGSGNATFNTTANFVDQNIATATANDPSHSTSEFSACSTPQLTPIVVTNTNDNGAGSLRQAIDDANTNPGLI